MLSQRSALSASASCGVLTMYLRFPRSLHQLILLTIMQLWLSSISSIVLFIVSVLGQGGQVANPSIVGTWSSGSQAVITGAVSPTFHFPLHRRILKCPLCFIFRALPTRLTCHSSTLKTRVYRMLCESLWPGLIRMTGH